MDRRIKWRHVKYSARCERDSCTEMSNMEASVISGKTWSQIGWQYSFIWDVNLLRNKASLNLEDFSGTSLIQSQSKSHVTTDGQSISMSWCKVHSGTCDQILYSVWKSLWGALPDERSVLSPVSHFHKCLVHCQRSNIIYIVHVICFKYM
jgi:hypothetical protein